LRAARGSTEGYRTLSSSYLSLSDHSDDIGV
jgi:hypothetical protein